MKLKTITLPSGSRISWVAILNWSLLLIGIVCSYFIVIKELQNFWGIILYLVKIIFTMLFYINFNTVLKTLRQNRRSNINFKITLFLTETVIEDMNEFLQSSIHLIENTYNKKVTIPCRISNEEDSLASISKRFVYGSESRSEYIITMHPLLLFFLKTKEYLGFVIFHEHAHHAHKDTFRKKIVSVLSIPLVAANPLLFVPVLIYSSFSDKLAEFAADHWAASYCGKRNSVEALKKIADIPGVKVAEDLIKNSIKHRLVYLLTDTHPILSNRINFLQKC